MTPERIREIVAEQRSHFSKWLSSATGCVEARRHRSDLTNGMFEHFVAIHDAALAWCDAVKRIEELEAELSDLKISLKKAHSVIWGKDSPVVGID